MPPRVEQHRLGEERARPAEGMPQANADPAAFGAGVGQAMQSAGATIGNVADRMDRRALQMATEDNEALAKQSDTKLNTLFRNRLFDPEKGYLVLKGQAAVDGYKGTMEDLEKALTDEAAAIKSPEARRMLEAVGRRRLDTVLDTMAKHAATERRSWIDGVSVARTLSASDDAIAYASDPQRREAAINQGRREIIVNAADHGEDPQITERKLREFDTKTYKGVVERMATFDPLGAKAFYEEHKHRIDGQQQIGLEKMLKESGGRRTAEGDANEVMAGFPGGSYATKVGGVENAGRYDGTPNRSTNAGGKYQFKDDTWLSTVKAADPEFAAGKSDADLLKLKSANTPEGRRLQDKAFAHFTRSNEKALTAAGVEVNDATRYLAHWFGSKGAADILKADPSTPISSFFKSGKGADGKMRTPDDWAAENGIKGLTAGQAVALARKRMGSKTTALPDEIETKTYTDPKEKAREIEANFAEYVERARALYGDDVERMDRTIAVLKQRKQIAEEAYNAQLKVDKDNAWKVMMTPDASGLKPGSVDVIPPDLWVKLDPLTQGALERQAERNLTRRDPPDNDQAAAEYYRLNRMAQDDPDAFKALDLLPYHADLPKARWNDLVGLQRSIIKGDAKEFTITRALQIARRPLMEAGFDLGQNAHDKDKVVLGQFTGALQDWLSQYQEINKKAPSSADVLKQIDFMLIQGRVRGSGFMGNDWSFGSTKQVEGPKGARGTRGSKGNHMFNFQIGTAERDKFYVPYDTIPEDRRSRAEQMLIDRGYLKPRASNGRADDARKRVVEDWYGRYLAGGGE